MDQQSSRARRSVRVEVRVAVLVVCLAVAPLLAVAVWATVLPVPGGGAPGTQARLAGAASDGPIDAAGEMAGSGRCAICHFDVHQSWKDSRHSRMVQAAGTDTVKGDFSRGEIVLHGEKFSLHAEDGEYFVTESVLTRRPVRRRVDFTLGNRRIQHYLTTLDNGRIILLVPSWNVQKQEWFHNMDVVDPEFEHGAPVQVWNKDCLACHVTGAEKRYEAGTGTYRTEWSEFPNGCERCHGSGREHVERHLRAGTQAEAPDASIVVQTDLDPLTNSMVCAQCHAYRAVVAAGYQPGDDLYDYFMPLLEYSQVVDNNPTWWADGRTRRFSNNAAAIWQSGCFRSGGLTCTMCHVDSHAPEVEDNPGLRPHNNALCTRCHAAIAADLAAHSHHEPDGPGSSCIACHMPYTTVGIQVTMRDHTISMPVPENTRDHGISNACNACHEDRTPDWALEALERWFPGSQSRKRWIDRAAAYTGGRARDPKALQGLLAILADTAQGPLPRANAAGYLGGYAGNPIVVPALLAALEDSHPQVRAVAAEQIGRLGRRRVSDVRDPLTSALLDARRIVRTNAAMSLLEMGVNRIQGKQAQAFEQAKRDLVARAALYPDSALMQFNLGKMYLLDRRPGPAVEAFARSLGLEQNQPRTRFALAQALAASGSPLAARRQLERFRAGDPWYHQARRLLERLDPPAAR